MWEPISPRTPFGLCKHICSTTAVLRFALVASRSSSAIRREQQCGSEAVLRNAPAPRHTRGTGSPIAGTWSHTNAGLSAPYAEPGFVRR